MCSGGRRPNFAGYVGLVTRGLRSRPHRLKEFVGGPACGQWRWWERAETASAEYFGRDRTERPSGEYEALAESRSGRPFRARELPKGTSGEHKAGRAAVVPAALEGKSLLGCDTPGRLQNPEHSTPTSNGAGRFANGRKAKPRQRTRKVPAASAFSLERALRARLALGEGSRRPKCAILRKFLPLSLSRLQCVPGGKCGLDSISCFPRARCCRDSSSSSGELEREDAGRVDSHRLSGADPRRG